jgi:hypothetical protein
MYFPKSYEEKDWVKYLGKSLTYEEKHILDSARMEDHFNKKIDELHAICKSKNLYIPKLTNMDGNCLFESLIYHGIGTDIIDFRAGLAHLMYQFRNLKNFLPHTPMTLEELFKYNEDQYVYTVKENKKKERHTEYYKYTYNVMCQDLANESSWSKLPTELILMVISCIYKVSIVVVNNSNHYEMNVNVYKNLNKPVREIYLGNLGESHYVPLELCMIDDNMEVPYYNEAQKKFYQWGEFVQSIKKQKREEEERKKKLKYDLDMEAFYDDL